MAHQSGRLLEVVDRISEVFIKTTGGLLEVVDRTSEAFIKTIRCIIRFAEVLIFIYITKSPTDAVYCEVGYKVKNGVVVISNTRQLILIC